MRRIIGLIILIIGIALIGVSMYIKGEVAHGRRKIASAQSQVDTGTALFETNRATKGIGKDLSSPFQQRIDTARGEADVYATRAHWLKIGGIILIIIGIGAIFIPRRK